jgi:hypothetical protein
MKGAQIYCDASQPNFDDKLSDEVRTIFRQVRSPSPLFFP